MSIRCLSFRSISTSKYSKRFLPCALGRRHGEIGLAHQVPDIGSVRRCDADRAADPCLDSVREVHRPADARDDLARHSGILATASPATMTWNSSPPTRATRCLPSTALRMRSAVIRRAWSPAAWPKPSFSSLNRSRSTESSASGIVGRVMRLVLARQFGDELTSIGQRGEQVMVGLPPFLRAEARASANRRARRSQPPTDSARMPSETVNAGLSWSIKASVGRSGMKESVPISSFADRPRSVTATRPPLVSCPTSGRQSHSCARSATMSRRQDSRERRGGTATCRRATRDRPPE